ncbi:MAG: hypothetical protein JNM67_05495 [Bacteroidetes bacterium]|nr:hypothetical protein [Bacteroidota bacterium]
MKRLNILWIFVAAFSVVLTSCYKEGPKISFKTKRDRLANEWVVTDYQIDGQTSDSTLKSFYVADTIALVLNIARNNIYGMNMQYTKAYSEKNNNKLLNLSANFNTSHYIDIMGNLTKNNILYRNMGNGGKWSFMDKFRRVDFSSNDMGDLSLAEGQKNMEGKVLMLKNDKLKIEFTINDKPHTVTFEPLNPEVVK